MEGVCVSNDELQDEAITALFRKVKELEKRVKALEPVDER
jgi:hypothetical protein